MKREEAIQYLESWLEEEMTAGFDEDTYRIKSLRMAIEALSEPKVIVGIDTPYGSDMGIATVFKGKDDKLFLEDIKEVMTVVRCKDCKHYIVEGITTQYGWCHEYKHSVDEDDYCSYGERKK